MYSNIYSFPSNLQYPRSWCFIHPTKLIIPYDSGILEAIYVNWDVDLNYTNRFILGNQTDKYFELILIWFGYSFNFTIGFKVIGCELIIR